MKVYNGQLKNVQFNIEKHVTNAHTKGQKKVNKSKCLDIFTFDIETTSYWLDENDKVIPYEKGRTEEYWSSLRPMSLCYIWQFGYNDNIYYGRELIDFLNVLDDLPKEKLIIWVHNLSFEYATLTNILHVESVFAKTPHKPMKCTFSEYPHIEFRCSYMLSGLSLDNWGKEVGCLKHTNDLNYDILRTPYTPLNEKELLYCEYDDLVVYNGIKNELKTYKDVFSIPLTKTGKVRKVLKERLFSVDGYNYFIKKLVPTLEDYTILRKVFSGGYTHANRYYTNKTITGLISHWDFTSSYPTVMVCKKYPMGKWKRRLEHYIPDNKYFENYAFMMRLKFKNIYATTTTSYIQLSKCEHLEKPIRDNGRLIRAEDVEIWVTELDYMIIQDFYKWDDVECLESYYCIKDYLPKEYISFVLELYAKKTELKGLSGEENETMYAYSKATLNSLFGVSVTDICQSSVEWDDTLKEWYTKPLTVDSVKETLNKLYSDKTHSNKYFASYSWGVWVCAWGRYALFECLKKCPNKVIYCDTDSLFVLGVPDFSDYNIKITKELKKACDTLGLDFNMTHPKDIKGVEHPLGIFEREEDIKQFKTLHAKCYLERRFDNEMYLTVSGIGKDAVKQLKSFDDFSDGFQFDKDADYKKPKMLPVYITDMPNVLFPDGYVSNQKCGINLRRGGYKLGITEEYKDIVRLTQMDITEVNEIDKEKLKGVWINGR